MDLTDALLYGLGQVRGRSHRVLKDLAPQALTWRPDAEANSIAWLLWHLGRVIDAQVAEIAGAPQRWVQGGWAPRFGLPAGYDDTGYGHTRDQVAAIAPAHPSLLDAYIDEAVDLAEAYLGAADAADFDRVVDTSYDPPVTAGVRLMSAHGDALQHVGQASYVRGLWERRG